MNTKSDRNKTNYDHNIQDDSESQYNTNDIYYRLISGIVFGVVFFAIACIIGLWASTSAANINNRPIFWNFMYTAAFMVSLGGFFIGYIFEWPNFRGKDKTKNPDLLINFLVGLIISAIIGFLGRLVLPVSGLSFLEVLSWFGGGVIFGFSALIYLNKQGN